MKKLLFVLVLLSVLVASACQLPSGAPNLTSIAAATATPSPAPVSTVIVVALNTVGPLNTAQPVIVSPTPSLESVSTATCILDSFPEAKRFGVQLSVTKLGDSDWEFDPTKATRVKGDVAHLELKKDVVLAGCPMLIEGRKVLTKEHHIWILTDKLYLDTDGVFRGKEFSAWAYPSNWNMEDFTTEKAPIAAEFVDAKRHNMQANEYDWPIFVHLSSGNTMEFQKGVEVGAELPNNCDLTEPTRINVAGVFNPTKKNFQASIGGELCWTAAKIDGTWTSWQNAKDNVVFKTIEAWLMPSSWSEDQIDEWIAVQ